MEIKLTNTKYTPEELRERFPFAIKAFTKEEARRSITAAMQAFPGVLNPQDTVDYLLQKFEESYGFKEDKENEFGEVSP